MKTGHRVLTVTALVAGLASPLWSAGPAGAGSVLLLCGGQTVTVDLNSAQTPTNADDVILGTPGPDIIQTGGGRDIVCAGDGDDQIHGEGGDDELSGDGGDDAIFGGGGDDELIGGKGNDTLDGKKGNDLLRGGPHTDTCIAESGIDTLQGCENPPA